MNYSNKFKYYVKDNNNQKFYLSDHSSEVLYKFNQIKRITNEVLTKNTFKTNFKVPYTDGKDKLV